MDADWPLIGVRFALYATLSGLFGLSAFSLYGLKAGERADALALRPWLVGTGLLGLLFSGIALVLLAAAMAGAPPWPIDREAIGKTETAFQIKLSIAPAINHKTAKVSAGAALNQLLKPHFAFSTTGGPLATILRPTPAWNRKPP